MPWGSHRKKVRAPLRLVPWHLQKEPCMHDVIDSYSALLGLSKPGLEEKEK